MTIYNSYSAAWLFDIYHPDGTIYVGTVDDGAYIGCCLSTDMELVEEGDFGFFGVNLAARIGGVRFQAITGDGDTIFDPTAEWRNVRVRIRHKDFLNNVTESFAYHGVIVSAEWRGREVIFGFSSQVESVLDTLIPTYTINAADFATASGVGACIPVVYGSNVFVKPQMIAHDTTAAAGNAGGEDYAVHYGNDATIVALFGDIESRQSGLEKLTQWTDGPGTPTYASLTTFTVSGSSVLDGVYTVGRPLRYKDTAGGSTWQYTFISDYTAGTVTVADSGLDAGLTDVELAGEFTASRSAYSIDGTDITTIRLRAEVQNGLTAQVSRGTWNAAQVIKDILENTDWGLSQTCDSTSFTNATTALTTAGLNSAVQGALGLDGRQRRARDVLNELCSMYGIRLWYDAADNKWKISVDAAPSAATLTFGLGDGTYENVFSIDSVSRPSLSDAVSTLEIKYGPLGFGTGNKFGQTDWAYQIVRTVLAVGKKETIYQPWLRTHDYAKRVLYYRGKTLEHGDIQIVATAGMEARGVTLGSLVNLDESVTGFDDAYRVRRIERRLGSTTLHLVGYDAEIFTYADDMTTPTEPDILLDQSNQPTLQNMLLNPDFSPPFIGSTWPATTNSLSPIAYWFSQDTPSSVNRTFDTGCVGNYYLTLITDATPGPYNAGLIATINDGNLASGIPDVFGCIPGESFIFSCYTDKAVGISFQVTFFDSGLNSLLAQHPPVYCASDDYNSKGWKRYYSFFRAPASSAGLWPILWFNDPSTTYKVDAVQFERVARYQHRPTAWRRNIGSPMHEQSGDQMLRRTSKTTNLTGTSVNLLGANDDELIPAGAHVRGVTVEVMSDITYNSGGTSWSLGDSIQDNAWASSVVKNSDGDTTDATNFVRVNSLTYTAAEHVVITAMPAGKEFASGSVRAVVYYTRLSSPL